MMSIGGIVPLHDDKFMNTFTKEPLFCNINNIAEDDFLDFRFYYASTLLRGAFRFALVRPSVRKFYDKGRKVGHLCPVDTFLDTIYLLLHILVHMKVGL